jgi:hypothetical protein
VVVEVVEVVLLLLTLILSAQNFVVVGACIGAIRTLAFGNDIGGCSGTGMAAATNRCGGLLLVVAVTVAVLQGIWQMDLLVRGGTGAHRLRWLLCQLLLLLLLKNVIAANFFSLMPLSCSLSVALLPRDGHCVG